jgi:hypothetical protein
LKERKQKAAEDALILTERQAKTGRKIAHSLLLYPFFIALLCFLLNPFQVLPPSSSLLPFASRILELDISITTGKPGESEDVMLLYNPDMVCCVQNVSAAGAHNILNLNA